MSTTAASRRPPGGSGSTSVTHRRPTCRSRGSTWTARTSTRPARSPTVDSDQKATFVTQAPPRTIAALTAEEVHGFAELVARLAANIESVVLGKSQVVRLALTALFAEGHILLE